MASGITHARVATTGAALLTASAAALYVTGYPAPAALGIVAGAVAGIIVTPDIDMMRRTHEETRIFRKFGPVAGRLFQAYWAPYAAIMQHRGISHAPVLGTLTRLVYVLCPALVWLALQWYAGEPVLLPSWVLEFGTAMFVAWAVQDALHLLWDL